VVDVGGGELLIELSKLIAHAVGEALGMLDLWWEKHFGRSLSGRLVPFEFQTLFHGNTRGQDRI